jgi:integrase
LGTPFFTDSTIFSLRSNEYAFIFLPYPAQHHRNPLSGLVSATGKGTPLDTQNVVNRHFKPLLRRAGLPDIRFHDLRHTCATLLARKNVNPKIVQDTLGHASLSMMLGIDSHVQAAMKDEAAALTVRADAGTFCRFQKGEACSG